MDIHKDFKKLKKDLNLPFEHLRDEQVKVLKLMAENVNCLAVLPTGYGKSIPFSLFPLLKDVAEGKNLGYHTSIVVSPLRALMKSQMIEFNSLGIKTLSLNCRDELSAEELTDLSEGRFSVIIIGPEVLQKLSTWPELFANEIYDRTVCSVTIDEAHVLQTWGTTFRTNYRLVEELRARYLTPLLVTTATMTDNIRKEIFKSMHLTSDEVTTVAKLPNRQNIYLEYLSKSGMVIEDSLQWYATELKTKGIKARKSIIYIRNQIRVGLTAKKLMQMVGVAESFANREKLVENRMIDVYHSSQAPYDQQRVLEEFVKPNSSIRCVIATVALGMGVNIPDVDLVIHWGASTSILDYWQEVGRAGRAIPQASAYLYAPRADIQNCGNDMQQMCGELNKAEPSVQCYRAHILSALMIQGMDKYEPQKHGACHLCYCCYLCKAKCQEHKD